MISPDVMMSTMSLALPPTGTAALTWPAMLPMRWVERDVLDEHSHTTTLGSGTDNDSAIGVQRDALRTEAALRVEGEVRRERCAETTGDRVVLVVLGERHDTSFLGLVQRRVLVPELVFGSFLGGLLASATTELRAGRVVRTLFSDEVLLAVCQGLDRLLHGLGVDGDLGGVVVVLLDGDRGPIDE
jgi:hypothetical protein